MLILSPQSSKLWWFCLVIVVFLYTGSGHIIGRIKCYFKDFILMIKRLCVKIFLNTCLWQI